MFALIVISVTDADAQRKNRYSYKNKNTSKQFSKYKGGKVGYSGVGNPKYTTIGVSMNMNNYFGDISNSSSKFSTDYKFIPDGFGITASKVLYPGIFLRGGFNYGQIKVSDYSTGSSTVPGPDASKQETSDYGRWARNYQFKNSIKELSLGFEVDMIPSNGGARRRFPINPYMFVGVAVFHHAPKAQAPAFDQAGNPTGKKEGEWVDLHSIGTEGQYSDSLNLKPYSKVQFSLPLGLGVKVKLARSFDLNFEVGFRYLFTDYLDDIGGNYANLDYFGNDHLARALSERGAESKSLLDGKDRGDLSGITSTHAVQLDRSNADLNWSGGSTYTHGYNYVAGQDRASSKYKDFLVTTQIRLVYILDKKGMAKGKFR
ncbi:DUF6089 family protein [Reichenbachiella agarivorans]|uniref:DUF6089 family protein n=1 Tax=Reichenbachiella agarivorans TaxID=2979464 RepID=A0ABY6CWD4_9BACT|nr:DUF6089 family protein [Reichenbachiella agarivorans]UXP33703.1 DUF6089 family protein [Reichenbachiella agarivorans]